MHMCSAQRGTGRGAIMAYCKQLFWSEREQQRFRITGAVVIHTGFRSEEWLLRFFYNAMSTDEIAMLSRHVPRRTEEE
jgi:hypothetical protein